jgi:hypothetical protein
LLTIPGDAPAATRGAAGLVTCATTARVRRFPSPDLVAAAAAMFPQRLPWGGHEGPRPLVTVGPGVISVGWPDVSRAERSAERAEDRRRTDVDLAAMFGRPELAPSRVIEGWSSKSRARMVRTLAELDYGPLLGLGLRLPMTTLTYPGDWLTVAPDGQAVKAHLRAFFERFRRAWGFGWVGIWKLEFQRRGAPHVHLWGPEPVGFAGVIGQVVNVRRRPAVGDGLPYRAWLSAVWADVVAHPDPVQRARHALAGTAVDHVEGARLTDPRRLAIYFTKHGGFAAKEYQNCVPEAWRIPGKSVGRFWGYRGLVRGTAGAELFPADALAVARLLRRYSRSQGVTREVQARRVDTSTGRVYRRKVRRPVVRVRGRGGFLCVNDGPAFASEVARWLSSSSWSWASDVVSGNAPVRDRRKGVGVARGVKGAGGERSGPLIPRAKAGNSALADGGAVPLWADA